MIVNKNIITGLLMICTILICIAPFLHIDFPKKEKNVLLIDQKISEYNKVSDNSRKLLRENYENRKITAENYIIQLDKLNLKIDRINRELINERKEIINNNRVFGFKTRRLFLIGFGIRLPYIVFSLAILLLYLYSLDKLNKDINLKKAVQLLYNISFLISFYLVIWFMIPRGDLPKNVYYIIIGVLSILASSLSINLIKHFDNTISLFKSRIRLLIKFISKKRINYLDLAVQISIIDPKRKKQISDNLKKYDDELLEVLKKVDN